MLSLTTQTYSNSGELSKDPMKQTARLPLRASRGINPRCENECGCGNTISLRGDYGVS